MISLGLREAAIAASADGDAASGESHWAAVSGAAAAAAASGAVAAIEAVVGRTAGHLRAAEVDGHLARLVLTPAVLERIARGWLENGESIHLLEVSPAGRPGLLPATDWTDVAGGPDPARWLYHLTLAGPTVTRSATATADAVLHVRRDPTATMPWRGVPPLGRAQLTAALAGLAERALAAEARIPSKRLIPVSTEQARQRERDALRAGLVGAANILFPPTTQRAGENRPQSDWKPAKLGPEPEQWLVELAEQAQIRVIAALGVQPALVGIGANAGGTAQRAAQSQFHDLLILPLGRAVEAEASRLLEEPVRLRWPVHDDRLLVRLRAYGAALDARVPARDAWALARLDESRPFPGQTAPAAGD